MNIFVSDIARNAYLGKHSQNLILKTLEQELEIYELRGIIFPVRASSTVEMIFRKPGISLSDIARALDVPHQLIAQRTKILLKMSLIEKRADPSDGRRSGFYLTSTGRSQVKLLHICVEDISKIYTELYKEIDCDLPNKLISAIEALEKRPLIQRLEEIYDAEKEALTHGKD